MFQRLLRRISSIQSKEQKTKENRKQHPKLRENKKDEDEEPPWTSERYISWNLQTVIIALFTWLVLSDTVPLLQRGTPILCQHNIHTKHWHLVRFTNKPTWLGWGKMNNLFCFGFLIANQKRKCSDTSLKKRYTQVSQTRLWFSHFYSAVIISCFVLKNLQLWSVSDHFTWCQDCRRTSGQLIYWTLFLIDFSLPAVLSFCSPLSVCHNTSGALVPFPKVCFNGG